MEDMNDYFNKLATAEDTTVKGALYRHLYRIESICRENWNTMPADVQSSIIETVQQALEFVRSLPSAEA